MSQKKKLSNRRSAFIISIAVAVAILSAILITNIFIPIKYLSAYLNLSTDKPATGEMRMSCIDVGDGECTLIEFPDGKVALFDGGNGSYNSQLKIFKKLNASKINKIDYLFCASSSARLCGGLAEIVKYKEIGEIFAPVYKNTGVTDAYRNFINQARKKNKTINECRYGAGAYSEEYGYYFCVLYPPKSVPGSVDNINSSAIWISYGGTNVLLLGDLSSSELIDLSDAYAIGGFEINGRKIVLEDCNVVKLPSGMENDIAFNRLCDLISPETAILSTNVGSAPSAVTNDVNYLYDYVYRTSIDGTVTLSISGGNYEVKKER